MFLFALILTSLVALLFLSAMIIFLRARRKIKAIRRGTFIGARTVIPLYVNSSEPECRLESLPPSLIALLLFHEDDLFFVHHGFNFPEIFRSFRFSWRHQRFKGGSSITQQLAKTLFFPPDRGIVGRVRRKLLETIYTLALERTFSKWEILELYVNSVTLGKHMHGIVSSAYALYGVTPQELTLVQSELLVSLIPGNYRKNNPFGSSHWGMQRYNYNLSYEKIISLLRWFSLYMPEGGQNLSRQEEIKQLVQMMTEHPGEPGPLSQELERAFQLKAAQIINQLGIILTSKMELHTRPPLRYSGGAPSIVVGLVHGKWRRNYRAPLHAIKLASKSMQQHVSAIVKNHYLASIIGASAVFPEIPEPLHEEIKSQAEREAATLLRQKTGLVNLVAALGSAASRLIVVKGPDIAERLYAPALGRCGYDLDILVSLSEYPSIADRLRRAGYENLQNIPDALAIRLAEAGDEAVAWRDRSLDLLIDVHIFDDAHFDAYLKAGSLRTVQINDRLISWNSLSDRDLFIYLCRHGRKHGWNRLLWLEDIKRLNRRIPPAEMDTILTSYLSREKNLDLILPLYLARHLLEGSSRPRKSERIRNRDRISRICDTVVPLLLSNRRIKLRGIRLLKLQLAFELTFRGRLRVMAGLLLRPTINDIRAVQLPLPLFNLYHLIRPVRGAWKMLAGAL